LEYLGTIVVKILIAIDNKPQARRVLNYLVSNEIFFRRSFDYSLIHVAREHAPEEPTAHLGFMMEALDFLRTQGIQAHPLYREGDPAVEIVHMADKLHMNMIVMSSRGHSALQSLMLGSVTTQVLARAKMPVLVIR
jgi:nucleotide-binding universal stress UspA family protein